MAEHNPAMKLVDMKKVLMLGKDRPLQCAYGIEKGGMALLLDPRKPGRMMLALLKEGDPNLQQPTFGVATRDEEDEHHLQLLVNKPVPGHAKRLAKSLRGTVIKKVSLLSDKDTVVDAAEDDEREEGEDVPPPPEPRPETSSGSSMDEVRARLMHLGTLIHDGATLDETLKTRLRDGLLFARQAMNEGRTEKASETVAELEMLLQKHETIRPPEPQSPPLRRQGPVIGGSRDQVTPEQRALSERLRGANRDISQATQLNDPGGHLAQDREALVGALAEAQRLRAAGDLEAAAEAVTTAQRIAVAMLAKSRRHDEQQQTWDRMAGPLEQVRRTYLTPVQNEGVRKEKLNPGGHFTVYLEALTALENTPTPETAAALEQAARDYLVHFERDLNKIQQGSTDNQRKRQICEAAITQARHMRMALEMQRIGPPPWDEMTAMQAAEIRAGFQLRVAGREGAPADGRRGRRVRVVLGEGLE